jgi:hypothetical protein
MSSVARTIRQLELADRAAYDATGHALMLPALCITQSLKPGQTRRECDWLEDSPIRQFVL